MLVASMLLLAVGGGLLVVGVILGVDDLATAAIAAALASGGLLAIGVARQRPMPRRARPSEATWAGATPEDRADQDPPDADEEAGPPAPSGPP